MTLYLHRFHEDTEALDAAFPDPADDMAWADHAGRLRALGSHYATRADFEAARAMRLCTDPQHMIAAFFGRTGGPPSCEDIADLLRELCIQLSALPEMEVVADYLDEAARAAAYEARIEREREEESLLREHLNNEERRASLIGRGILTC